MPLIDDRGRLFGRVNLIDLLAALLLLGLIPLGYGGYLLFRVPEPTITTIFPDQVVEHHDTTLQITGNNIRPFLTVRFGGLRSDGLFVQSSTQAEVRVPSTLPVGVYDVNVLDQERVLFSKRGGLTVLSAQYASSVETDVQLLGTFVALNADEGRSLAAGAKFAVQSGGPAVAEVLAVRAPAAATRRVKVSGDGVVNLPLPGQWLVQAIVRLPCTLTEAECRVGQTALAQDAALILSPAASRSLRFVIDEVRPASARPVFSTRLGSFALASVRVRFTAPAEVLAVVKAGDLDVAGAGVVSEADRAVLTQIGTDRQPATISISTGRAAQQLQHPELTFSGTMRVPVVNTASGWTYKNRPIKAGAGFQFETAAAIMTGWIVDVRIESER